MSKLKFKRMAQIAPQLSRQDLRRWGNSLGVCLPAAIARESRLHGNQSVDPMLETYGGADPARACASFLAGWREKTPFRFWIKFKKFFSMVSLKFTDLLTSSWTTRLATATGTLAAVALSPAAGKAAVIKVTGSPVSLSLTAGDGATSFWDVDGDGSNDFRLFNDGPTMFLGSDSSNGRGLVAPASKSDNVIALNTSFNVGPTLASGAWGSGSYTSRNIMEGPNASIGYDFDGGFGQGDNFFGFRFEKLGGLHYGYAIVNFDSPNETVTISRWAYNNVADGIAHVEAIAADPSAVPGPIGLAGLAAGAAWTRKLRRRIKTAA
jgi:antitoxin component of MazEF toxin-antitoxin module